MALKIIRNDITKVSVDAVITTTNARPTINPGSDTAIHAVAGPQLLEARKQIGEIAPGSCAATPAFHLPAKHVLHAVCRDWAGGECQEAETLRSAYDSALKLADELGCRSVSSPLIGKGYHGFPRDLALSTAIQAFTDFLIHHKMTIYLVLFSGESFGLAESLFGDLKSYIDDNYVAQQKEVVYGKDYRRGAPPATAAPAQFVSLPDYLKHQGPTFTEYLMELLRERNEKNSDVYKRAEISKALFSKILCNKDYHPQKNTAIQLAIGLQLDMSETQKLLEKAGYALTPSSKFDLAVQYYIERKIYNVTFIDEALHDCRLPLLTNSAPN